MQTKITSYAGFKTYGIGTSHRFAFEHEVYFDYFVASALAEVLAKPDALAPFLDKGLISEDIASQAVSNRELAKLTVECIGKFDRTGSLMENRRQNSGALVSSAFRALKEVSEQTFSDIDFVKSWFGDTTFDKVKFKSCTFQDVRFEKAIFQNCQVSDSIFDHMIISKATRLDIEGLIPGTSLHSIFDIDRRIEIYAPSEMEQTLKERGSNYVFESDENIVLSTKAKHICILLQQLARRLRIANIICVDTDDPRSQLVRDQEWKTLESLLLQHGLFRKETRDTSGRSKSFIRPRTGIMHVMRYETIKDLPDDESGRFWRDVRAL